MQQGRVQNDARGIASLKVEAVAGEDSRQCHRVKKTAKDSCSWKGEVPRKTKQFYTIEPRKSRKIQAGVHPGHVRWIDFYI